MGTETTKKYRYKIHDPYSDQDIYTDSFEEILAVKKKIMDYWIKVNGMFIIKVLVPDETDPSSNNYIEFIADNEGNPPTLNPTDYNSYTDNTIPQ